MIYIELKRGGGMGADITTTFYGGTLERKRKLPSIMEAASIAGVSKELIIDPTAIFDSHSL